jgi:hypothetical protein
MTRAQLVAVALLAVATDAAAAGLVWAAIYFWPKSLLAVAAIGLGLRLAISRHETRSAVEPTAGVSGR